jgi:hypothetical protein
MTSFFTATKKSMNLKLALDVIVECKEQQSSISGEHFSGQTLEFILDPEHPISIIFMTKKGLIA